MRRCKNRMENILPSLAIRTDQSDPFSQTLMIWLKRKWGYMTEGLPLILFLIFTDRIRRMREGNVFSLSTPGGGVPGQVQTGGGGTPARSRWRGVPYPALDGGVPQPGPDGGVPLDGVPPPARSRRGGNPHQGWGCPPAKSRLGGGIPGTPPRLGQQKEDTSPFSGATDTPVLNFW